MCWCIHAAASRGDGCKHRRRQRAEDTAESKGDDDASRGDGGELRRRRRVEKTSVLRAVSVKDRTGPTKWRAEICSPDRLDFLPRQDRVVSDRAGHERATKPARHVQAKFPPYPTFFINGEEKVHEPATQQLTHQSKITIDRPQQGSCPGRCKVVYFYYMPR